MECNYTMPSTLRFYALAILCDVDVPRCSPSWKMMRRARSQCSSVDHQQSAMC